MFLNISAVVCAKNITDRGKAVGILAEYLNNFVTPFSVESGFSLQPRLLALSSVVNELRSYCGGTDKQFADIVGQSQIHLLSLIDRIVLPKLSSTFEKPDFDRSQIQETMELCCASMGILRTVSQSGIPEIETSANNILRQILLLIQRDNLCQQAIKAGSGERLSRCVKEVINCLILSSDLEVKYAAIDILSTVLNLNDRMSFANGALGPIIELLGDRHGPPLPLWCRIRHKPVEYELHHGSKRMSIVTPELFNRVIGLSLLFDIRCPNPGGNSGISRVPSRERSLVTNRELGLSTRKILR